MNRISGLVIAILVLLVAGVLIAGCTDSAPADTTAAQPSATATTSSDAALYTAGDIVRSPQASAETGYLIIRYDAGSDSYERAFINRNNDGSWGYRIDSSTVTLPRAGFEKVYSVKITHVDLSQVSLGKPMVTATTNPGAVTTTSTPVTTTPIAMQPRVKDIVPDNGQVGTSVTVTDLQGEGFQSGASVMLARFGSENISATNVNVLSDAHISCTLSLPSDATVGIWDIIVTNPDGQSTRYSNVFTVRVNAAATATTTTSTTGGITINSIDPTSAFSGDYKQVIIYGANFKDGITGKLTRNGYADIPASTVSRSSETTMQCFFSIPTGSFGAWNLVLTNTDGTTGTLTNGFSINS